MRGKYIVLEGGAGSGISEQAERLIQKLATKHIKAVYVEEPGGTPFAQQLSEIIRKGPSRTASANVLAFNAARAETMAGIEQQLRNGSWVVANRSFLSTIVYQGYGEGQDIEHIREIARYAVGKTEPDMILVLDVSAPKAAERLHAYDQTSDYFEDMNSQFHDRVREGYRREARQAKLPVINADQDIDQVAAEVWQHVSALLKDKPTPRASLLRIPSPSSTQATQTTHEISDLALSHLYRTLPKTSLSTSQPSLDYAYYTPPDLTPETREVYDSSLRAICDTHARLTHVLTNYIKQNEDGAQLTAADYRSQALASTQAILPVALTQPVIISIDAPTTAPLSRDLPELTELAKQLGLRTKRLMSHTVLVPDDSILGHSLDIAQSATLITATARNEVDLLPFVFYGSSELSLQELRHIIDSWPIAQKIDSLRTLYQQGSSLPVLDQLTYCWDIVADYSTFAELVRLEGAILEPQLLTPRFGFELPKPIEAAGLDEVFEKAFEMSFLLYDLIAQSHSPRLAQYCTLQGHKLRFQLRHTARQASQLFGGATDTTRPILLSMRERLAEVHPLLSESLSI